MEPETYIALAAVAVAIVYAYALWKLGIRCLCGMCPSFLGVDDTHRFTAWRCRDCGKVLE